MIILFLKHFIISILLFAFYWFLLRHSIHHTYNRWYLILLIPASFIIPYLPSLELYDDRITIPIHDRLLSVSNQLPLKKTAWNTSAYVLFSIYTSISAGILCYYLYQIRLILRLRKRFPTIDYKQHQIYLTDITSAPFSFFHNIFWNKAYDITDTYSQPMLRHELAHVSMGHSWDRLYFILMKVFLWWNPIVWLIDKSLQLIHEYQADQAAVRQGDSAAFAKMFLQHQMPNFKYPPAQPLFFSHIKSRLIMINKTQRDNLSLLRKIAILPLFIGISSLFAHQVGQQQKNIESILKDKTKVDTLKSTNPILVIDGDEVDTIYMEVPMKRDSHKSQAVDRESNASKSNNFVLVKSDGSTDTIYIESPTSTHSNVQLQQEHTVNTSLHEDQKVSFYVVNGEKTFDIGNLHPNDIVDIKVLKGEMAKEKYGAEAEKGVIEIITK